MARRAIGLAAAAPAAAIALIAVAASSFAKSSEPPASQADRLSTNCGTFPSKSIYPIARVYVLRGVGCLRARRIAQGYDHQGKEIGAWDCALSHVSGKDLFACGKGGAGGNIRKWPHALVTRGEGQPEG